MIRRWSWGLLVVPALGLLYLLFTFVAFVRDCAYKAEVANRLKLVVLAMANYRQETGHFPPAVTLSDGGEPLYSWRVALLPYLGQEQLHRTFRLDEPWDSPHNLALLPLMPDVYGEPEGDPTNGLTYYQVFVGPGTAFERPGLTGADFPDGLDKTLLVVKARQAVPWTRPADLPYRPDAPLPDLVWGTPGTFGYRSEEGRCVFAAFGDVSARQLLPSTPEGLLRAVITRNRGEVIPAHFP